MLEKYKRMSIAESKATSVYLDQTDTIKTQHAFYL